MANVSNIDSKADNGIFVIFIPTTFITMWDCIIKCLLLTCLYTVEDFSKMFIYRCQKHDEMYKSNETLHVTTTVFELDVLSL